MSELARRIAITIGALLIFRLGYQIPIAGLAAQSALFQSDAIRRLSLFSLVIFPYLSAAIIIQLVSVVWGKVSALERSGEAGRRSPSGARGCHTGCGAGGCKPPAISTASRR